MATPKQAALLEYLGIHPPTSVSDASELIDELTRLPEYEEKLRKWHHDRMWLHPSLYASELEYFRSTRVALLRDSNNKDRGPWSPLKVLTTDQVAQVIRWLDERSANWDHGLVDDYGVVSQELFNDGFIPLAAQLLPGVVKRGHEEILSRTPVF